MPNRDHKAPPATRHDVPASADDLEQVARETSRLLFEHVNAGQADGGDAERVRQIYEGLRKLALQRREDSSIMQRARAATIAAKAVSESGEASFGSKAPPAESGVAPRVPRHESDSDKRSGLG